MKKILGASFILVWLLALTFAAWGNVYRQGTEATYVVNLLVDATDQVTPEDDILFSECSAKVIDRAGNIIDISDNTVTTDINLPGVHFVVLTATQLGTLGYFDVIITSTSTFAPYFDRYEVVSTNNYDSLHSSTDNLDVTFDNTTIATVDNPVLISDGTGANQISLTDGAVNSVTLVVTTTTNSDMRGTDNAGTEAKQDIIDNELGSVTNNLAIANSNITTIDDKIGTPVVLAGGTATIAGMVNQLADNEDADFAAGESLHDIAGAGGGGITAQQVRDAMKLAPSGGALGDDSIDSKLNLALADLDNPNQYKATGFSTFDNTTDNVILGTNLDKTNYTLTAANISTIVNTTVASNWNEILTGATYNINTSAGKRLRQLQQTVFLAEGTAQAGAAGTITLEAGSSVINNFYEHTYITVHTGTGAPQARLIHNYIGSTLVASVTPDWKTNPGADSEYLINGFGTTHAHEVDELGTQAKADVNEQCDIALTDYDPPTNAELTVHDDKISSRTTAARMQVLDDWINGGRLDLLLDAVALEATLTAMKGGGWSTETLVTIEAAIATVNGLIAALNDPSATEFWTHDISDNHVWSQAAGRLNRNLLH